MNAIVCHRLNNVRGAPHHPFVVPKKVADKNAASRARLLWGGQRSFATLLVGRLNRNGQAYHLAAIARAGAQSRRVPRPHARSASWATRVKLPAACRRGMEQPVWQNVGAAWGGAEAGAACAAEQTVDPDISSISQATRAEETGAAEDADEAPSKRAKLEPTQQQVRF